MKSKLWSLAKPGAVIIVILAVATAYRFGYLDRLAEPKAMAATLVEMGAWGYGTFFIAYTLLQPFAVPGTVFIVAAPLIWPWKTAFLLSMAGTMSASIVGFLFARWVARERIAKFIPSRFRKYNEALERNGFLTVFLLRLIFWMPQFLHAFFGISKVGFWTHFWGSLCGYLPPLFVVSFFGVKMFDASGKIQPAAWPILVGMLAGSLILVSIFKAYERRYMLRNVRKG